MQLYNNFSDFKGDMNQIAFTQQYLRYILSITQRIKKIIQMLSNITRQRDEKNFLCIGIQITKRTLVKIVNNK